MRVGVCTEKTEVPIDYFCKRFTEEEKRLLLKITISSAEQSTSLPVGVQWAGALVMWICNLGYEEET